MLSRDNNDAREFIIPTNFTPTTNSGDIEVEVQEKVKYGFKFSGCNILNNVGSLKAINQYYIKGSVYVNHHMRKLCSVDKFQSIPLLYPEGMLFPFLHRKYKNEKFSIVGAIPSSLFNLCCIQEGLSSIQQHINTRSTSHSNVMGSDPRYIYHCYDIMEKIAASNNHTILFINHGPTVSGDKYDNLFVRGSGHSYILGSLDSNLTVKNICT